MTKMVGKRMLGKVAMAAAALVLTVAAQAQVRSFNIPAGDMKAALDAYIAQSGRQLVYRVDDLRSERSAGVQGNLDADQALRQLLAGSALTVVRDSSAALMVQRVRNGNDSAGSKGAPLSGGTDLDVGAEGANRLEQVLVTGTLRSTALQKTAMGISAITERALKEQGAESLSDVFRQVPGLQVLDRGPNEKKLSIRGIQNDALVGNNTVGVYVDDFPISLSGAQLNLNLFDVARVEVLRGPQGTLYGASSMTGTIRYITNQPNDRQFQGEAQLSLASTKDGSLSHGIEGMVNLPLSPNTAALRAVAYKRHSGGYIDRSYAGQQVPAFAGVPANGFFPGSGPVRGHPAYTLDPIAGKDANEYDVQGGRLVAQIKPLSGLVLRAGVLGEDGKLADRNAHQPDTAGVLKSAVSIRLPANNRSTLSHLTGEWDLGATALYASLNHARSHSFYTEQFTGVFPADLTPPGTVLTTTADTRTNTQEVRWRSNTKQRLGWIVGAWNYEQTSLFNQQMYVQQTGALQVYDTDTPTSSRQKALFGELSYELLPGLTATAGLRHWRIRTSNGPNNSYLEPAIFFLDPKGVSSKVFGYKDEVNKGKLSLAYELNPDLFLYTTASQGFRVGGFNANPTNDPSVPAQYKSDSLWNYEAGAKGSALDKRLQYNVTVYHINWSDIQTRVFVSGAGFNGNAGRAHSTGVEFSADWRPVSNVSLTASGAFMDARLDEDMPVNAQFPTGVEGKRGDRLPGVPRVTLALGAQYTLPQWLRDWDLVLRADVSHAGKSMTQFRAQAPADPSLQTVLQASTLVNLRATLREGPWEVAASVNNVFNAHPSLDVYKFLGQPTLVTTVRPRTFGLRVSYAFD